CTSAEGNGLLRPVADIATQIKALKGGDPERLLVTVIGGAKAPYQVHWKAPSSPDTSCGLATCPWPEITHSCTLASTNVFADPAVRLSDWVDAFAGEGLFLSIC